MFGVDSQGNTLSPDFSQEVYCPAGETPISGGWSSPGNTTLVINESHPADDGAGWVIGGHIGGPPFTVLIYADCVQETP